MIAALIATVAVVSGGYDAQRLDLGDGSVWVANGSQQAIGRANTEILALDTAVDSAGSDIRVVQDESTVLLVDRTNNKVDIVDQPTATVTENVPLPPESPEVFLAAQTVVVHATGTGEIWFVPIADFADFDAESEPTRSFGVDSVISVSPAGVLFVYSPDAQEVYRIDVADPDTVDAEPARLADPEDDVVITSVSDRWVLLDRDTGDLSIEGRVVRLGDAIPDVADAELQLPTDTGERILVSHPGGLVSTTVAGGTPRQLVAADDDAIVTAAPIVVGDCSFAAWSTGAAWRECDGAAEELSLDRMPAAAAVLTFARRGDRVALSDARTGRSWAVQADGELMDNWDELLSEDQDQEEAEENDEDLEPEYEKDQVPPIAVDDQFGARPSRASVLPVLLNDYDPNGDVLVVSAVDAISEGIGRVDVINDRQQLQLTLAPTASGTFSFGYTVSDGRGGTAAATVLLTVRQPGENQAPAQVRRPPNALVVPQGTVTASVLGDWVDPDGDAFYLSSAAANAPDSVTYKPEGTVVFRENGGSGERRSIGLAVSDGVAVGSGELQVSVSAQQKLYADPFAVDAYAGQEITISPLLHARGGIGPIRLSSVPTKPGSTVTASLESGTFRFVSDQVRVHFIDYVVTDGEQTATRSIRIDVQAPPDANSTPITVPKTIFVQSLSQETVDIASSDIDPAGGVLLVTSVDELPASSGVGVELLNQSAVRVTLLRPLDAGPVTFGYRVTNGLATADGSVTVVEVPRPSRFQPPVAVDDSVTVRAGDAIDIAVLANDEQPDGGELTLDPVLTTDLPRSAGLLFVAGDMLRYLAPGRPGNFTAVYQVTGPDGQFAQGQVAIAVREAVEATNTAPVPVPVTARVLAGESVRIPIPLTGTDPDGDAVQLLGQETNPEKGSVTDTGVDYLEYLAGDYSAGTDSFTYTLIDSLGARATGTVRIGIAPRTAGARNPVAVADEVRIRPGKTVSVQALANDSDPDGGTLTIRSVEPSTPDVTAVIVAGEVVDVTPPAVEGRYGLVYTIENELGGTSSNFITVVVDSAAPPSYPVARDTVLTLADILDRDTVAVDVLRNVFFADGDVSSLSVTLLDGYSDSARVTAGKRISVTVQDSRQIIPFAVGNPDDPTVVSYAFVWVPGLADTLPQLDRTRRPPTVVSESPLTIDVNDYVLAVGGREVRLTDSSTVRATNSNGEPLVVNSQTLRFVSADTYFGPASISFEVTDGATVDDPDGRRATIVLPIVVQPRENQPPVFAGGVIDFEPGESKSIDLFRLTTYSNPEDSDELRYQPLGAVPAGFSYTITGSILEIRADEQTARGSSSSLIIGVRDATSDGQSGRIQLDVVASTRPLARPAADVVIAPRGRTTTVDVLANDEATNPFPGRRLRVLGIRGLDGSSVPAGVSITPSADNSRLSVTVSAGAEPGDTNLQYQVADITGDPERLVYGSVRVSVQDRPDAPPAPVRADGGYEEGQLTLRLTPPVANNSPITGYIVTSTSRGDYRHDCGLELRCALSDLQQGQRYQFSVVAVNAVGASDPSTVSAEFSADYLPAAPVSVTAQATDASPSGALRIDWSPVPDPSPGSAVVRYVVRLTGPGVDFTQRTSRTSLDTTANGSLVPDAQYVATVYAQNSALVLSDADWRRTSSAPVTTVGVPGPVSPLTATSINPNGDVQVVWGPAAPNGGSVVTYRVLKIDNGSSPPDCTANAGTVATTQFTDQTPNDGDQLQYVVYAYNNLFCSTTVSQRVESKTAPGAATARVQVVQRGDTGQFDLRVDELSVSQGSAIRYEVSANAGASWSAVPADGWLTSAQNGQVYGNAQTYLFRGCRDNTQTLCGAASGAQTETPVNTRATVSSCRYGDLVQVTPPFPGAAVTYQYAFNYDTAAIGQPFGRFSDDATAPPAPAVGDDTRVAVQATVTVAGNVYTDPLYAEGTCVP